METIENFLDLKEEKELNLRLKAIEDKIQQMEERGFFMNQQLMLSAEEDAMLLEEIEGITGGASINEETLENQQQIDSRINELKNLLVQQK
jgi:Tfp pilus assembly protein PilO